MNEENLKDIPGFEGLYAATKCGKIWSYASKRFKDQQDRKGYRKVMLFKNGKCYNRYVHRLVWETYRGPIPKGMEINHLNEIRDDNRLENLELVTHYQNLMYGNRTKKHSESLKRSTKLLRGGDCNFATKYKVTNLVTGKERIFSTAEEAKEFSNLKAKNSFYYFLRKNNGVLEVNGIEHKFEKVGN